MSDDAPLPPPEHEPRHGGGNTFHQEVQHAPATARVPDAVGRGVFGTHAIVMQGGHEFLIDFIQGLAPPRRVVSRIVLPISVIPLFVAALEDNLRKYTQVFGAPPRPPQQAQPHQGADPGAPNAPPTPPPAPPPITEVYEQLKLPDDMLGGSYANAVVISHSHAEFCFDFICNFYPRSVVTSRVYMAAPHVTEVFDSLQRCLDQFRQKQTQIRVNPLPEIRNPPADETSNPE
jgi:Protein of unknown function (DUF3467)